jgi:(p)ppGpp synthase/HD superfamily hydrolase
MQTHEPFLTDRFDMAFKLASELHHNQARKGIATPYIAHLMSVCALVLEFGGHEDQAIAALLHDAMEDQGGLPTLDKIRRLFGDRVANVIRECSDSESADPNDKPPYHQRKKEYLNQLRDASPDAQLVSAADKLHNARAMLLDYRQLGDELWGRFNREATKQDHLNYYRALVTTFRTTKVPKAMVDELDRVVTKLERLAGQQKLSGQPLEAEVG